ACGARRRPTAPMPAQHTRAGTTRRAAPAAARSGPEQRVADDLAKLVGERLARTFAAAAAHLEQVEVVGNLDGLGDVLIDEQDRHPGGLYLAQALVDLLGDARRQAGRRLVHQQEARLGHPLPGERGRRWPAP